MNRLQIFQKVYGESYIFSTSEIAHLYQVSELIVRECINMVDDANAHREPASTYANKIKQHFGVVDDRI